MNGVKKKKKSQNNTREESLAKNKCKYYIHNLLLLLLLLLLGMKKRMFKFDYLSRHNTTLCLFEYEFFCCRDYREQRNDTTTLNYNYYFINPTHK